jgi:predicted TIM-barrel fold metal-dependent hydrolase
MLMSGHIAKLFDADNHYWESSDAFTRHRAAKFKDRGLQIKEVDGVVRYVIDGEVFPYLPGPSDVHKRPEPGAYMDYFQGKTTRKDFIAAFTVEPSDRPEWYNRDARLRVMDDQGVEATWMFPSQGVVLEASLHGDLEASLEVSRAFNRWIEEEWGFAYQQRIFGVPYMNLSDPDRAVEELQWCVEHGARVVTLRHGPAVTNDGSRSPADPMFDRFWGLAQEANIVVAPHAGADHSYLELDTFLNRVWATTTPIASDAEEARMMLGTSVYGPLMKTRLVHDFAYVLVAHKLFERFPRLRVAYIENGGAWVPSLLLALDYLGHTGAYTTSPRDQFVENCWVAPFVEESVDELARHIPVDRILFGSDWPHGEGFQHPRDFLENVSNFSPDDQQRIMYENARKLTFAS